MKKLERLDIPDGVTELAEIAFEETTGETVIHALAGSCAERYARENNIKFQPL